MLQRLRENKSSQGTLLALPTTLWMLALLIIPLLLTLVVSFGRRTADGNVIYTFSLDNYIRLLGFSTGPPIESADTTGCLAQGRAVNSR